MVWYFLYGLVSLLWDALRLSRLSPDDKTLELLVLRQQLLILRRHQKRGPAITFSEKFILLTLVDRLCGLGGAGKARLEQLILIFKPETLLRWHQALVKKKWTFLSTPKTPGRPAIEPAVVQLILRMANENRWGHRKIEGELKKLGYRISDETIRKLLRQHHIPPLAERKSSLSWHTFLNHYRKTLLACDFFTVETIRFQTLYVFFFIELGTRRVHLMGITPHPTQQWVTQQARQLIWKTEAPTFTHLIRDNDGKYGASFDAVFKSEGIEVVRTPFRAPRANAYAERWVRSVREECLDQLIILNERHLAYVLREYERYFNTARPHQGICQQIPDPPLARNLTAIGKVERRDILGGIIHDYFHAA
jgi:putative transposase